MFVIELYGKIQQIEFILLKQDTIYGTLKMLAPVTFLKGRVGVNFGGYLCLTKLKSSFEVSIGIQYQLGGGLVVKEFQLHGCIRCVVKMLSTRLTCSSTVTLLCGARVEWVSAMI